jgi:hypothetical protein
MRAAVECLSIFAIGIGFTACGTGAQTNTDTTPSAVISATPGTVAPSSSPTPLAWSGKECHPVEPPNAGLRIAFGDGRQPLCVTWIDDIRDETGFRVNIAYVGDGTPEEFSYDLPANAVEFVVPADDRPKDAPLDLCLRRQAYTVGVTAIRPGGDAAIGSVARSTHCLDGR